MDFEKFYNRLFGEKIKEYNAKMLTQRLEYRRAKDKAYDSVALILTGLTISIIIYLHSCNIIDCLVFLGLYICFTILYYTERTRKCKECGKKMKRFEYNDKIYFCCDDCRTIIKCIIMLGNDS